MLHAKMLRPDSKGRVALGVLAKGVSSFKATVDDDNRIVLEPYSEVPSREKWLFDNPKAMASLKRGLNDAKAGRVKSKGTFAKYADDSDDDT
jgi:hypothetical protein